MGSIAEYCSKFHSDFPVFFFSIFLAFLWYCQNFMEWDDTGMTQFVCQGKQIRSALDLFGTSCEGEE